MTVPEAVRSALRLLSRRERRLLLASTGIQMSTALLDLVGVLLLGLVGALAVTTVQSAPPPTQVTDLAQGLGLSGLSDQQLVFVLATMAAAVLVMRSAISSYLTRRVLIFLANRQALISARLVRKLLAQPLAFVQERSSQETAYALIYGAGAVGAILGQMVIAVSELVLLLVLAIALLAISPAVALGSIAFFTLIAYMLQLTMGNWSVRVGRVSATADIASLNAVQEALSVYREISVMDRRHHYVDRVQALRWDAARAFADKTFMGMIPKYVFDVALVFGGLVLAGFLFATQGAAEAAGLLALFLAAATRVMPSLLRLQSATLGLRGSAGAAGRTFELASALGHPAGDGPTSDLAEAIRTRIQAGNPDFVSDIHLHSVSLTYPQATTPALSDVSLDIKAGTSVALVGRSGAGKSTLADVILGLLQPSSGEALIGGLPAADALATWPGGISYVPQKIVLANDSVRSNVALGLPPEAIDDALVVEALERVGFGQHLINERDGLGTRVGEDGLKLSGGQRQRLGIARALYTRPHLLVLDEATSSLDAETESAINQMIHSVGSQVTTVIIAHRLSTVRDCDVVVYLEEGRIRAIGDFDQVRQAVPAFHEQARLMGLGDGLSHG